MIFASDFFDKKLCFIFLSSYVENLFCKTLKLAINYLEDALLLLSLNENLIFIYKYMQRYFHPFISF
jgi:hypothetical protein